MKPPTTNACLETYLTDIRKEKEARKQRHEPLAASRAADKQLSIDKWTVAADKAISELSWRQKKDLALIKFAAVYEASRSDRANTNGIQIRRSTGLVPRAC
jgi:hypothetical protein